MDKSVIEYRKRREKRLDARFEENKHPRDENGRFASGSGSPDGFENRVKKYISGGVRADIFSKADVDYMKNNMETQNTGMFRIENGKWLADKLKPGKVFSFDKDLKSFSRSEKGAENVLANGEDYGLYEDPVVYMTLGKTKHFNIGKYSDDHAEEEESLVGGKFRVEHIGERTIGKKRLKCVFIKQIKE